MARNATILTRAARLRARLRELADYARQLRIASRGDGQQQRLSLLEIDDEWKQRIFRNILGA